MARQKLTLEEFREDFPEDTQSTDTVAAQDVLQFLDEKGAPEVVRAARAFLEASQALEMALVSAGLRRQ